MLLASGEWTRGGLHASKRVVGKPSGVAVAGNHCHAAVAHIKLIEIVGPPAAAVGALDPVDDRLEARDTNRTWILD